MRVRRVVIGLLAGLVLGSAIGASHSAIALRVADALLPIGQLWVNAIRMTIVPLVMSLLFVGVARREAQGSLQRLSLVTAVTYVGLLCFCGGVALVIVPPLINDMQLSPESIAALRSTAQSTAAQTTAQMTQLPGFASWVTGLVPANIVKAIADGAMLPVIVFTLLFALATRRIDVSLRDALVAFFGAIATATTTIVDWIIAAAPIGVFALITASASRMGLALAGATAYYVLAISAAFTLFALLTYPVASMAGRLPLGWFVRGALPAQIVALSSSSSLASLPAMVEGGRAIGLSSRATGFVLPLSVSVFKAATPISWLMGALFLAKLYGVTLAAGATTAIVVTAIALSFTIPGVPQGSQLLLAPLLVSYGMPAEGIALLIAADTVPDLFGTMANVTSDFVAATVVSRFAADDGNDDVQGVAETLPAGAFSPDA